MASAYLLALLAAEAAKPKDKPYLINEEWKGMPGFQSLSDSFNKANFFDKNMLVDNVRGLVAFLAEMTRKEFADMGAQPPAALAEFPSLNTWTDLGWQKNAELVQVHATFSAMNTPDKLKALERMQNCVIGLAEKTREQAESHGYSKGNIFPWIRRPRY